MRRPNALDKRQDTLYWPRYGAAQKSNDNVPLDENWPSYPIQEIRKQHGMKKFRLPSIYLYLSLSWKIFSKKYLEVYNFDMVNQITITKDRPCIKIKEVIRNLELNVGKILMDLKTLCWKEKRSGGK